MGVGSDLRFGIFKKLAESGIEIPYPQRDAHIRGASAEDVSPAEIQKQKEEPVHDGEAGNDPEGDTPRG